MTSININPGAPPKVDFPLPKTRTVSPKTQEAQVPQDAPRTKTQESIEPQKAREIQVRKAATALQGLYPINSTRFTIFKDASGQFITRFTDMVDGSVKHIPEPELIRMYEKASGQQVNVFQTQI